MPSTLLSIGVIFFGFTLIVYGETDHRLGSNEQFFAYYAPESEDVQMPEQEQKQYRHSDSSGSLNPQYNANSQNEFQSSETSLHTNGLYPMPLSISGSDSKDPNSLFSTFHKSLAGILTENEDGEENNDEFENGGNARGVNSVNNFNSLTKRTELGERLKAFRPNSKERYRRIFRMNMSPPASWATQEIKRERTSPDATLSVDSSLNVIRQLFLQKLRRQQIMEKQRQIQSNGEMLSNIGKRDLSHSS